MLSWIKETSEDLWSLGALCKKKYFMSNTSDSKMDPAFPEAKSFVLIV